MKFKYRVEDEYYVLVQESSDLKATGDFEHLEYTEFAKIKKEPHNYHFHKASATLKRKGVTDVTDGSEAKRDNQSVPNPEPPRHIGVVSVSSSPGQKAPGERGNRDATV